MAYISAKDIKRLADIATRANGADREALEEILDKCELTRRKENERVLKIITERRKTDKSYAQRRY